MTNSSVNPDIWSVSKQFPYVSGYDFESKWYLKMTSPKKWIKIDTINITTKLLYEHFNGDSIMSLPIFEHTKTLMIDIDEQKYKFTTTKIMQQLIDDIGQPFYYEQSKKGHIHVYFEMKDYVSEAGKAYLEQYYCDKFGYTIEANLKVLRLPYSKEYKDNAYNGDLKRVKSASDLLKSFESKLTFQHPIPKFLKEHNKFGKVIERGTDSYEFTSEDLYYGFGTRHDAQIRIAFKSISNNLTYDEFCNECDYYNDGTSKDMKLNSFKKHKILKNVWDWANDHYKQAKVEKYESNKGEYLNEIEFTFNDKEYDDVVRIVKYYYQKFEIGKLGGVKEKEFISNVIIMLEEIYSKFEYHRESTKKYIDPQFDNLNKGPALSLVFIKMLADYHQIKNYKKVWYFIKAIGFLNKIVVNGYSYSYKNIRYAIHYTLEKINNLIIIINNKYRYIKNFSSTAVYSFYKLCRQLINNNLTTNINIRYG